MCIFFADASAQLEPLDTDGDGFRNVSTPDNILWISLNPNSWNLSYELDNNIDLQDTKLWNEGLGFSPIGSESKPFSGVFEGHNFTISNLTINRPEGDDIGFFGVVSSTANIRNIRFTTAVISGNSFIGIITGKSFGFLDNIYATGSITSVKSYVGGITGENTGKIQYCRTNITINGGEAYDGGITGENYGTIYYSRSLGEIHSSYIIGGLVGDNSGLISDCYSRANIIATDNYIGGLAGSNWETGSIINSFSTGKVKGSGYYQGGLVGFKNNSAKDSACFWDTDASDIYESVGGEGKTTSEMKDVSTFLEANWDFINTWIISSDVNDGYPHLIIKSSSIDNEMEIDKPIISFSMGITNETIDIDINSQNSGLITLYIYDVKGNLVLKSNELFLLKGDNKITQNFKGLYTGAYFAVIYLNQNIYTKKFIFE